MSVRSSRSSGSFVVSETKTGRLGHVTATRPRLLTSLLATLLIMTLSGRSMVLAMVSTTSRAWRRVGQSNRLYITFCFRVQSRSSWKKRDGIEMLERRFRQQRGGGEDAGPEEASVRSRAEDLTSSTSRTVASLPGAGLLKRFSSSAAAWSAVAF